MSGGRIPDVRENPMKVRHHLLHKQYTHTALPRGWSLLTLLAAKWHAKGATLAPLPFLMDMHPHGFKVSLYTDSSQMCDSSWTSPLNPNLV